MSLNERVHKQPADGSIAHLQRLANLHKIHSGHGGEILKKVEGEIEKHHGPQALQHVRDASAGDAHSFKSHVNKAEAASSAHHNHGSVKMEKTEIVRAILSKDETKLAEAKAAIKELLAARATQFRADSSKFVAKSLFESEQVDEAKKPTDPKKYDFAEGDRVVTKAGSKGTVRKVSSHQVAVYHDEDNTDPKQPGAYRLHPHDWLKKIDKE